jgi:hypothetical protein
MEKAGSGQPLTQTLVAGSMFLIFGARTGIFSKDKMFDTPR